MFASAYKIVKSFTGPVVMSFREPSGRCGTSIGSFVILNRDGWCLTAAHILEKWDQLSTALTDYRSFLKKKEEIERDGKLSQKKKNRALRKLAEGRLFLTNRSDWWGQDGIKVEEGQGIKHADIAAVRLGGVTFDEDQVFPVIKDPETNLSPGTSLCRLGFPFHSIVPTFDPERGFILPGEALPLPMFPIEGIMTRQVNLDIEGLDDPPRFPLRWIETSSPGLRGQSGGPIFDTRGTIWGIQSQTMSWPLGIDAQVAEKNGRPVYEHQVLNTGVGVHPATICGFLDELNIEYQKSDY